MYTIISGTNRINSHSEKVAKLYQTILKEKGIDAAIFSLIDIDVLNRSEKFEEVEKELMIPSEKFIFIIPEYNGTFPGVLKAMIDITDVKKVWWGKKALLTGVSTGRAGNLRGMDQLTGSLNHMKVMPEHLASLLAGIAHKPFDGGSCGRCIRRRWCGGIDEAPGAIHEEFDEPARTGDVAARHSDSFAERAHMDVHIRLEFQHVGV